MDSSPCGGTQPHWRNAGNSCQTPPGVPALELSHPPIRPWTERHGAEDVQSEWREESHLCGYRKKKERVESERKQKSGDSSAFAYSSFSCWLDHFFYSVNSCCFNLLFFLSFWTDLERAKDFQAPRIWPRRPALCPPLIRFPSASAHLPLAEMMMYFWVSNASAAHQVGLYAIVSPYFLNPGPAGIRLCACSMR